MIKFVRGIFFPTPEMMQVRLLMEAKLDLIESENAKEHWVAQTAMLQTRVARLQRAVTNLE